MIYDKSLSYFILSLMYYYIDWIFFISILIYDNIDIIGNYNFYIKF